MMIEDVLVGSGERAKFQIAFANIGIAEGIVWVYSSLIMDYHPPLRKFYSSLSLSLSLSFHSAIVVHTRKMGY